MALYSIPRTKMLDEAKTSRCQKGLLLELVLFLAIFMIYSAASSVPVGIAETVWLLSPDSGLSEILSGFTLDTVDETVAAIEDLLSHTPAWVTLVNLFATGLSTAAVIVFSVLVFRRTVPSFGLRKRHPVREYLVGAVVGAALFALSVGFASLVGSLSLSRAETFSPALFLVFLLGYLLQGMSEEVLCRGYMLVSVSRKHSLLLAVLTNSLLFSLLHLLNPGFGLIAFVNIALFGALESVWVLKRGNLWGAAAIHSLWNFTQGNVFGVSVSGTGAGGSGTLFLSSASEDAALWNGGSFGLEGGLAVTVVVSLALLASLLFLKSDPEEIA